MGDAERAERVHHRVGDGRSRADGRGLSDALDAERRAWRVGAGVVVLERDEIVFLDRYDLGVAVQTDDGLVVPVVRDCATRSVEDLAADVAHLAESAREGKLKPEELRGSTFTVTSAGKLAGLMQTPIVNHPEVAILSIGLPVYNGVRASCMIKERVADCATIVLADAVDHQLLTDGLGCGASGYLTKECSLSELIDGDLDDELRPRRLGGRRGHGKDEDEQTGADPSHTTPRLWGFAAL